MATNPSHRLRCRAAQVAAGAPVRPIMCRSPEGELLPIHQADVVLMSYEQLRDQLYASGSHTSLMLQFGFWRCAPAGRAGSLRG